jgi:hypothetical protein
MMNILFEPNLHFDFNFSVTGWNKHYKKYSTNIRKDEIYIIKYWGYINQHQQLGEITVIGRIADIDYNTFEIKVDCSKELRSDIRIFNLKNYGLDRDRYIRGIFNRDIYEEDLCLYENDIDNDEE